MNKTFGEKVKVLSSPLQQLRRDTAQSDSSKCTTFNRNSMSISMQQFCNDSNILLRPRRKSSFAGIRKNEKKIEFFFFSATVSFKAIYSENMQTVAE